MFLGKICEIAPTEELFGNPLHPYTRFLMEAIPKPDPHQRNEKKSLLSGEMPSPVSPPPGCRFHTRCPESSEICRSEEPRPIEAGGRTVACHHAILTGTDK
jgi:oligopeptide/dipeptide ABC transporter ATP-binding protein